MLTIIKPPSGYRLPNGAARVYAISVHLEGLRHGAIVSATFVVTMACTATAVSLALSWVGIHITAIELIACSIGGSLLSFLGDTWRRRQVETLTETACVKIDNKKAEAVPETVRKAEAPAARAPERPWWWNKPLPSVVHSCATYHLTAAERLRAYVGEKVPSAAEIGAPVVRIPTPDERLLEQMRPRPTLH
jgi:hypothetical protein